MSGTHRADSSQIEWCRAQQADALEHMKPDHKCDHPQCHPDNNRRWLMDVLAEELEITYVQPKGG
jgi:hypothetical protein